MQGRDCVDTVVEACPIEAWVRPERPVLENVLDVKERHVEQACQAVDGGVADVDLIKAGKMLSKPGPRFEVDH